MIFGLDMTQLAVVALVLIAGGGLIGVLALTFLQRPDGDARFKSVAESLSAGQRIKRVAGVQREERRKKIQETLKQFEETEKQRRERVTLRVMLTQAGLETSPRKFWIASFVVGTVAAVASLILGAPTYVSLLSGVVGVFGLSRWALSLLRRRRIN